VVVTCPVTHALRGLNDRIHEFLREVTLADMIREGERHAPAAPRREFRLVFRPLPEEI
jgi:DNA-binding IscR family transcriptional regulator